ncbi:zinc finger X-chromosomal protein-like [Pararge aegeria]|uniref:zinc finger X-chromosomal protein-like n=1 Tax=Pararge aegeria TaxID=116150 RepID=UPI0019CFC435|nr:zinc finger X-chromosomal protein-like [Pararge aegeria]
MAFPDSTRNNLNLNTLTSSLNKYFICDHCGRIMLYRSIAVKHLKSCMLTTTCSWCNIKFKNRGNLVRHKFYVHGDKSAIKPVLNNGCPVCPLHFRTPECLKYHIRSIHFNLKTKTKSYDDKKINQIWHEKVFNTSKIVEIKKAAHNLFLIRKLEDDTEVTVQECDRVLDLSDLYPTNKRSSVGKCRICFKSMLKRDLKKHYDERHMRIQKHTCNNCDKTFKRSVLFVRHVCNKLGSRRRKLIL